MERKRKFNSTDIILDPKVKKKRQSSSEGEHTFFQSGIYSLNKYEEVDEEHDNIRAMHLDDIDSKWGNIIDISRKKIHQ